MKEFVRPGEDVMAKGVSAHRAPFARSLLGLLLSCLTACASPLAQPLTGVVVDASTGQGLGDVVVLATWSGNVGLVDRARHCAHVESAVTDAHGHFRLAGAPEGRDADTAYQARFLEAYKEGYRIGGPPGGNERTSELRLKPEQAPPVERFDEIAGHLRFVLGQRCGWDDGSDKNLYRLHVRQVAELGRLVHDENHAHQWRHFEAYLKLELVNRARPTQREEIPYFGSMSVNVDPNDALQAEDLLK